MIHVKSLLYICYKVDDPYANANTNASTFTNPSENLNDWNNFSLPGNTYFQWDSVGESGLIRGHTNVDIDNYFRRLRHNKASKKDEEVVQKENSSSESEDVLPAALESHKDLVARSIFSRLMKGVRSFKVKFRFRYRSFINYLIYI